jgi:hypothetical protein
MGPCSAPLARIVLFLPVPNVTGLFVLNAIPMVEHIAVGLEDIAVHHKFEINLDRMIM